jgi:exopolyphosphatase / guanosine-5'-triphosphate,3'-diphosphate pyrophosphatase
VLEGARLRLEPNSVTLEVTAAARAPDSEVVSDRLRLLANAIGVKRSEVVDIDETRSR